MQQYTQTNGTVLLVRLRDIGVPLEGTQVTLSCVDRNSQYSYYLEVLLNFQQAVNNRILPNDISKPVQILPRDYRAFILF